MTIILLIENKYKVVGEKSKLSCYCTKQRIKKFTKIEFCADLVNGTTKQCIREFKGV
jgi:hypothetical protein